MSLTLIYPQPDFPGAQERLDGVLAHALAGREVTVLRRAEELERQIDEEEMRTEEIEEMRRYMQTDRYVEEVARDKLGLVYPDEVIFKPEE